MEWVRFIITSLNSTEAHSGEISFGIVLWLTINGIDIDIRRKFVALGI